MSTTYEAHLVVGCYVSDIMKGYPEGSKEDDMICEVQDEGVYEWYEDEGILGVKVKSSEEGGYSRKDLLSLVGELIEIMETTEADLGCTPEIHVCIYTY